MPALFYVKRKDAVEQHFAILYGNTSVLLLGPVHRRVGGLEKTATTADRVVVFAVK